MGRCLFASRPCERIAGARHDMVFIAAPSADEYHFEVNAAKEIVNSAGLLPEVAVHRQLLSEDIFCEKICACIIESRFCIVFINGGNPNVFYEYGLMRPLRKRVISLLRADERPAFNVGHLDTVSYQRSRLKEMLAEAVDAASEATRACVKVKKRTSSRRAPSASPLAQRVSKLLELQGVLEDGEPWLRDLTSGTGFSVRRGPDGVYLVSLVETEWRLDDVLADVAVICRRAGAQWNQARRAIQFKQRKGWSKVDELQPRVDDIEHLHFLYATSVNVDASVRDIVLATIRGLGQGFPLPAVDIWTPDDVNACIARLVGTQK